MNESRKNSGTFPKTTEALQKLNSVVDNVKKIIEYEQEIGDTEPIHEPPFSSTRERQKKTRQTLIPRRRTKQDPRSRFDQIIRRHNIPSNRLGRRQSRRPRKLGSQTNRKSNRNVLRKRKRNNEKIIVKSGTPISEPFRFMKNFGEPQRSYKMNGQICSMKGVEFLTSLQVNTTAYATPAATGDLLYVLPMSPMFMAGTDIYKEAQCWEKFKWEYVRIRYIPTCPSTTNGALMSFSDCDGERPTFSIVTDGTVRLREGLSRKASKEFHPFGEELFNIPNPEFDDNLWYDVLAGGQGEDAVPSVFNVMVASPVTDPNGSSTMTLGQLILEYGISFGDKGLIDAPTPSARTTSVVSSTATALFAAVTQAAPVGLQTSVLGITMTQHQIAVLRFTKRVFNSTTASTIGVMHREIPDGTILGPQGTVHYGFTTGVNTVMYLSPNLMDAMLKLSDGTYDFTNAVTGTDTITFECVIDYFDTTLDL